MCVHGKSGLCGNLRLSAWERHSARAPVFLTRELFTSLGLLIRRTFALINLILYSFPTVLIHFTEKARPCPDNFPATAIVHNYILAEIYSKTLQHFAYVCMYTVRRTVLAPRRHYIHARSRRDILGPRSAPRAKWRQMRCASEPR